MWVGEGGEREDQEGGDIGIPMADSWQKSIQYSKAVILQFKKIQRNNPFPNQDSFWGGVARGMGDLSSLTRD